MDNKPRKCAIYCRVSTPSQREEGTSLETQEQSCRDYAAKHGYVVDETHVEVFSGAELWDRPELDKLRTAIRHHEIDVVVCHSIDRLSRNNQHLGVILLEAERVSVAVEFVTDTLDSSLEGDLLRYIKGYAGAIERERIRERTLRSKLHRAQSGKVANVGVPPYGYERDKERGVLIVYPPEARIVEQLFTWIARDGLGLRAVAVRLNEQGVPSPSARKVTYSDPDHKPQWCKTQVSNMIKDSRFKGEGVVWKFQRTDRKGNHKLRPRSEWIDLPAEATPAIVNPALWENAQTAIAKNRGTMTRNARRPYLLRNRIVCAVCGRAMWPDSEHNHRTYRCSSRHVAVPCGGTRVNADLVEQWTWERVTALLKNPDIIVAELKRRQTAGPSPALVADKESIQRQLTKIGKSEAKLVRRFTESDEDDTLWPLIKSELNRLNEERTGLQVMLADVGKRLAQHEATALQLDSLRDFCARVAARLDAFNFEEKTLALTALDIRVSANGKDFQLTGMIPPVQEQEEGNGRDGSGSLQAQWGALDRVVDAGLY